MSRIAFIGLGMMGRPMAHLLHAAGHTLVVRDALDGVARDFASAHPGTAVATQDGDFADCEAVITMLPNSAIVDAVVQALAGYLRPGACVVEMSSASLAGDVLTLPDGEPSLDSTPARGAIAGPDGEDLRYLERVISLADGGRYLVAVAGNATEIGEAIALPAPLARATSGPAGPKRTTSPPSNRPLPTLRPPAPQSPTAPRPPQTSAATPSPSPG
jgi:hypothetical protein